MECECRGLRADDRDRRREDCEAISTARCELIAASHFASRADHGEPITASQRSRWRQPARLTPCRSGASSSARFQNQVFLRPDLKPLQLVASESRSPSQRSNRNR